MPTTKPTSDRARAPVRGRAGAVMPAVRAAVRALRPGAVFTPDALLDYGSRAAVDQALSRLARAGAIRRLARGLYDVPVVHPRLGPLTPGPEAIAEALARRDAARLQVSGARAANALGLTTQVPGRAVYLTDGTPRTRRVGGQTVELRRASPRALAGAGTTAGAVVQALRHLGPAGIDDAVLAHLARTLSVKDRRDVGALRQSAPGWLRPALVRLANDSVTNESVAAESATRAADPRADDATGAEAGDG